MSYQFPDRVKEDSQLVTLTYNGLGAVSFRFPRGMISGLAGEIGISGMRLRILFLESYPRDPPAVFVVPGDGNVLKQNQKHVNSQTGRFYHEYLGGWGVSNAGSIMELMEVLLKTLSENNPIKQEVDAGGVKRNHDEMDHAKQQELQRRVEMRKKQNKDKCANLLGLLRQNASLDAVKKDLTIFASYQLQQIGRDCISTLEDLISIQNGLREAPHMLKNETEEVKNESEMLDQQIRELSDFSASLESSNAELERLIEGGGADLDIDAMLNWTDEPSRILVKAMAADLALEDAEYILSRKLATTGIGAEDFVREMRKLTRNQFMERRMMRKFIDF